MPSRVLSPAQAGLFGPAAAGLPEGWLYQADFLDASQEETLVAIVRSLPLAAMRYKSHIARRRVLSFGGSYDFDALKLETAQPLPASLAPLRAAVAQWLGISPDALTHALVAEYAPGTPLGWHRDVPDFEDVVGVSLLGEAVMRFRPYPPRPGQRTGVIRLVLAPRSVYLLRGPARWQWQHSVAPTDTLRYSITFRTARAPAARERLSRPAP